MHQNLTKIKMNLRHLLQKSRRKVLLSHSKHIDSEKTDSDPETKNKPSQSKPKLYI